MNKKLLVVLLFVIASVSFSAQTHPFLIVNESMYADLQARAANSPWKEMKAQAITDAANLSYTNPSNLYSKIDQMYNVVSTGALAYILNPAQRATYVQKLVPVLKNWSAIRAALPKDLGATGVDAWASCVPVGAAFFNSILCLDIIYKDVSTADIRIIDSTFQTVADWYRFGAAGGINPPNPQGTLGAWYLYKGDSLNTRFYINSYKAALLEYFTNDGIFVDGPFYAYERLSGEWPRDAKIHFMDVLEFTGKDKTIYSNTRIRNFYEWLYGYATSPANRYVGFCDSDPYDTFPVASSDMARIYRFSAQAAKYAAWRNGGAPFPGRLLHYVLMDRTLPSPEKPASKIFYQGYAGFCENNQNSLSLMGALWCCNETRYQHTHKEVNAVYMAAYGEQILLNAGYSGWKNDALGFPWASIHACALYGNTVMIKVPDHQAIIGGGITEGLTDSLFNYASGSSDTAIAYGHHQRNFCFVHPQNGKSGYFLLFDEVQEKAPYGSKIYMALHPNADNLALVTAGKEYYAKISPRTFSGHDVYLSIFHGTVPDSVGILNGIIAANYGKSLAGKFLYSAFFPNNSGKKNMVTVLFPYDAAHPKATMANITGANFSGASIDLGNGTVDFALESFGTDVVTCQGISFKGTAAFFRKNSGATANYFIRKGTSLGDNANTSLGFNSDSAISVYIKGNSGAIVSPGARVTFNYPNVNSVLLNGSYAQILNAGNNAVTVAVPAGTFSLQLSNAFTLVRSVSQKQAVIPQFSGIIPKYGKTIFVKTPYNPSIQELKIYDIHGKLVYSMKNEELRINNENPILWNGIDNCGRKVANGYYVIKVNTLKEPEYGKINPVK